MLLKPCFKLKNIYEINLEKLKEEGVKAIFFDLDSTIMVSKSASYKPETIEWLERVKKEFTIAVLSNNKNQEYIKKVQEISDFEVIGHANKPSPKTLKALMEKHGLSPKEIVMVGDRPLTDILAGKLLGARTILVGSINSENENLPTQVVRWLEGRFILDV